MDFFSSILKNKFSRDKFSLGLDIGTSAVKIIKLKVSKEGIELCGFDLQLASLDLTPLLRKIAQSQGGQQARINISVCGPAVIIRYVNFPPMNDSELKQALKFEAPKHIPFAITELNLDGYILKSGLADNKILVLLAAVKKEFVNQRLKLFESAALKPDTIDIDSLALINAFNFNYSGEEALKDKTIALLNIGSAFSNLNILEGSTPRLSRDIQIAGNAFTKRLADALGLDFKSAEELKLNPPAEKVKNIASALEAVFSNLAAEIRTSFDYYESQNASAVEKIFLSGAGGNFSGFKDILANLLGIGVEYWDPLKRINLSANIDSQELKALSGQFAVAVGLALHS